MKPELISVLPPLRYPASPPLVDCKDEGRWFAGIPETYTDAQETRMHTSPTVPMHLPLILAKR